MSGLPANLILPAEQALLFRVARYERVAPDREQIHRLLGLRAGHPGHRRWFEALGELLETLPRLMRPRAVYRLDPVRRLDDRRLELESNIVLDGSVGRFLAHSTHVVTFIATIGSAVERLSRCWLKRGRVLHGTIADAIASESAEAAAQACQDEVRSWATQRGMDVTPRYSPGYCGLNVRQQAAIFAGLPARVVNVRLTPSSLMVPIKSVSGLIGVGPAELVSPAGYPCRYCDHPHCMQRRAPLEKHGGTCFDWSRVGDCPPE